MARKSRMFAGLRTWNPWFGCNYDCYRKGCWARKRLAHRLGKMLNCQFCYDFVPHYHAERLGRVPRDPRIFVVAHGDLFGWWVPDDMIAAILVVCGDTPKEMWFFETKNPLRYLDFCELFPENTVLSTTIETNRQYAKEVMGYAPPPHDRFTAMRARKLYGFPLHVSIEPIMNFDLKELVRWIRALRPVKVAVGYDSLGNHLPEPSLVRTNILIKELQKFCDVEIKYLREAWNAKI